MKKKPALKILLVVIAIVVLSGVVTVAAMDAGKKSLKNTAESSAPVLEDVKDETSESEDTTDEEKRVWKDGWVKFNDEIYEYKQDIITFLIMGTDQKGKNTAESGSLDGGQADLLMLAVLDPVTKRIEIIPINRNTMADIDFYDAQGNVTRTVNAQIAVQHGVGDGDKESCEHQVKAVSRLFFQLPIHGYASMTMDGIIPLTEAVGGVDVVVPDDAATRTFSYKKGEKLHLKGKEAYNFVHDRDQEVGGADRRLDRQKVFLKALLGKVTSTIKDNPASIVNIYNAVSKNVTTDITANEMMYIAKQSAGYTFDSGSFHTIKGETTEGEISDEFHADQEALRELMIELFYEKVKLD